MPAFLFLCSKASCKGDFLIFGGAAVPAKKKKVVSYPPVSIILNEKRTREEAKTI